MSALPQKLTLPLAAQEPAAPVAAIYPSYQGEGALAGQRHLFLRFVGCNLRCGYCDAPETLSPKAACDVGHPVVRSLPNPVPLSRLLGELEAMHRQAPAQALAVTGGEPLLHHRFLARLLPLAKEGLGLPVLLETNALLPNEYAAVAPWVDVLSADVKLPGVDKDLRLTVATRRQRLMQTLAHLPAHASAYLKVVAGPGLGLEELWFVAAAVAQRHPALPWFVQPLTTQAQPWGGPEVEQAAALLGDLGLSATITPQLHVLAGLP